MRQDFWLERAVKIADLIGTGLSVREAANASGLTEATVRKYITKFSILKTGNGDKPERFSKFSSRVEALRRCAAEGKTVREAADEVKISYQMAGKYARKYGIEFLHASAMAPAVDFERAEVMGAMYKGGKTLAEIGAVYGISRERVRQIIKKRIGLTAVDGGQSTKSARAKHAAAARREAYCLEKYGCSDAQRRELLLLGEVMVAEGRSYATTPCGAWTSQRNNAIKRGIEWKIKLWDWWAVWQESGKWDDRGRTKGAYVMCRFGDAGAYEVGNVYIATNTHNATVQPNNPYRVGHERHDEVMIDVRRKQSGARRPEVRRTKHLGLPRGVTINRGRFMAQATINGKNKYIGCFETAEDAHAAYLRAVEARIEKVAA